MGCSGSGRFRLGLGSALGRFGSEWGGLVQAGLERVRSLQAELEWVGSDWVGAGRVASGRVWVLLWVGSVLNGVGWFRLGFGSALGRFGSAWVRLVQVGLEWVGSDWVGAGQVGSGWVGLGRF